MTQLKETLRKYSDYDEIKRELDIMKVRSCSNIAHMPNFRNILSTLNSLA
jgi:hypothetical protein